MTEPTASKSEIVNFAQHFEALTGFKPMRWQERLYIEHFTNGKLPSAVSVPTGLGKTAVMALWLIALAQQMRSGRVILPRRLVYVVDRRAVVDQATKFAEDLRANLQKIETEEMRDALGLSEDEALPISTLRGQFVDNRDWLADPSRPAIIIGTVDMIGSRLLFEGYGVSRKMRPYHAGLLGLDSLVMLDEAHLVPPFEELLSDIAENARQYGPQREELDGLLPKFRLLPLSATGRRLTEQPFKLEEKDFRNPDDVTVKERLFAEKRLIMQGLGNMNLEEALAKQAWGLALETSDGEGAEPMLKPVRIIVYCNSRDMAEKTKAVLVKMAKKTIADGRVELFVGARRVKERTDAEQRLIELGFLAGSNEQTAPAFLVATSAGEVGVDLDADHLVCDIVAWERMVQRFGRVNRRGGEGRQAHVIVVDQEPKPKKQDAPTTEEIARICIYRGVKQLLEILRTDLVAAISVSPESLRQLSERAVNDEKMAQLIVVSSSPTPLRPALNRVLLDAWSMTSLPEHTGRPEVAPWLRGWVDERPQTTVAWRTHLPSRSKPQVTKKEIEDFFEAAPTHASEMLEAETFRVMKWLKARAAKYNEQVQDRVCGILLTADGKHVRTLHVKDLLGKTNNDKKRHQTIENDLQGKTLIMSADFGGLASDGLLNANEKDGWLSEDKDKIKLPVTADGDALWMDLVSATPVISFRLKESDSDSNENGNDIWRENHRFVLESSAEGEATRWISIQKWRDSSSTENDRAEGRPQALDEHQSWAQQRAEGIGKRLCLPNGYITMLAIATRLHDEGKRASNWQRAFHAERDIKKFHIKGPLAKTRGPINQAVLDGYRHEFGSLPYAKEDADFNKLSKELQNLALHLIAAHHGFARPLISSKGCEDAPPTALDERAREVALRFARLQKHWGPWGLAWWEALLRAADIQASRENDNRGHV